jgi:hypothetical protein
MKQRHPTICPKTHKVVLSEAAALRRAERYDEIDRSYYCVHCDGWHLTSKAMYEDKRQSPTPKEIHPQQILDRYNHLIKKVKKNEI